MPEPPPFPKRQPLHAEQVAAPVSRGVRYAELHCLTNFSFLEGASHADELVLTAAELGYAALAVTDRNSLAGVVRAHTAAKDCGLRLLVGAEVTPDDAAWVVLLPTDRRAYGNLARLLTVGRRRAEKGECRLTFDDIAEHHEGLVSLVLPTRRNASAISSATEDHCEPSASLDFADELHRYHDLFGDRCYLLAELHYGTNDHQWLAQLKEWSKTTRVPLVAGGDVHYHVRERMPLQHVLTAIRHGKTVAQLGDACLPNAERHLRPLDEIATIFADIPSAVRRTMEIAERCPFSLDDLRYEYPEELAPRGQTPVEYLRQLAWQGAKQRYPTIVPEKVCRLLEHELTLIAQLRYEAFFLTVYDIVRFARSRNILCQGRGSAANSVVCYCLGVTAVDPAEHELLFERFISAERNEAPDIDVDFEHERREEVMQYIYNKYGRERAGLAATVITYRPRSAIRDVGKALGLSVDRVDVLAKNYDYRGESVLLPARCEQSGIDPASRLGQQLMLLVNELLGFPRHLSQHVGGMVITRGPLCELVPIENAAMQDRTVIEWDKDDLDELGILKVDCLCLGMLTAIRKCFDLISQHTCRQLSIATVPEEDPAVYDMICRADTVGVFQIESRAQMSMLPRLKPRKFYDLVIEVAIVRPGPIQGNMVHPYLRRRNKEEKVVYPSREVEQVLERTLGVPLFQEQAMQLAVVAAGFTPGEADQLRRAMGAWRRLGLIDTYRKKLIDGMLAKGYTPEFAEALFNQIRGFGEYGFPESHAASFAKLVYVSSWLKHYYPAAFAAAIINSQPMGFYAPAQLVRDARDHDVEVRPIDINQSDWDCTLEPQGDGREGAVRLGMRLVRGLRQADVERIIRERRIDEKVAPYTSAAELATRARIGRATLEKLADAGALDSLEQDRRVALWQALDEPLSAERMPLFADATDDEDAPVLPTLTRQQQVFADYASAGLSLRDHPVAFYRDRLTTLGITTAAGLTKLRHGSRVKVAGLVLMRQRPGTAGGITFVTLEDETGTINLVVHLRTWQRYELVARRTNAMMVTGRLERQGIVVHVIAREIQDLQTEMDVLEHRSRDFR
jgi:error-prone DNA polymerase